MLNLRQDIDPEPPVCHVCGTPGASYVLGSYMCHKCAGRRMTKRTEKEANNDYTSKPDTVVHARES